MHGPKCYRCALRLRILSFRQLRTKSTSYVAPRRRDSDSPPNRYRSSQQHEPPESSIRYHAGEGRGAIAREKRAVPLDDKKIIRKVIRNDNLRQWGLDGDSVNKKSHQSFREAMLSRLPKIKNEVRDAPILAQVARDKQELDGKKQHGFKTLWNDFTQAILQGGDDRAPYSGEVSHNNIMWKDLMSAWKTRGINGLDDRIKYIFYGYVTNSRFTQSDIKNQMALADLRYPSEWFPATRAMTRKVHLHVGPTNSGKTFQALQRLEQVDNGVYAGPLRLLAHEVYTRLNAKGIPCHLITGEERRVSESAGRTDALPNGTDPEHRYMSACTVEMVPLNKSLDVAVIDEIQMIGNAERGWAWTQAVLGVKAKEVHLCGEERTVPLIQELCASVGDKLEIHRYKRLSPLQMAEHALDGDLRRLRKGDCIVSFSVMGIHALRRQIEKSTGRKVATVYGGLPPETRAQQARLFNDPDNDYDYLVASDAVGMGLNLAIKRIIFEASSKFDGFQRRTLSIADIKQIGGRAGRFRTAAQANETPVSQQELSGDGDEPPAERGQDTAPDNVGLVTTLERFDFPIVRAAMESKPEPIQTAGLFPPAPVLERFASYFPPATPFSYMLTRLHELSQMHKRFHLCGLKDQVWIADLIESVQGLTITDRNTFCSAPAGKVDHDLWKDLMPAFARCVAAQTPCNIADLKELPLEILEADASPSREYLRELERLHKGIVTYLWLSYRFQGIFNTRALAFHVKGLVEEKIEHVLGQFSFSEMQRRMLAARREKDIMQSLLAAQQSAEEDVQGTADSGEISTEPLIAAKSEDENLHDRKDATADEIGKLTDERATPKSNDVYTESTFNAELDDPSKRFLIYDDQTSLTAGGDMFGGEGDLSLEEPEVQSERTRELQVDTAVVAKLPKDEENTYRKPNETAREGV